MKCIFFKDAGFVYESFQNKTNRIIWKNFFHETNPRNKSFKNESTKRIHETNPRNESFEHRSTKRIHETNLLNTVGIRESGPQDLYGFVVHLCSKDS